MGDGLTARVEFRLPRQVTRSQHINIWKCETIRMLMYLIRCERIASADVGWRRKAVQTEPAGQNIINIRTCFFVVVVVDENDNRASPIGKFDPERSSKTPSIG